MGLCCLVNVGTDGNELFVANCITQLTYGRTGVHADVQSILASLDAAFAYAVDFNLPLYMPKIGCGLGGLDWTKDVLPIVTALSEIHDKHVYVCDL